MKYEIVEVKGKDYKGRRVICYRVIEHMPSGLTLEHFRSLFSTIEGAEAYIKSLKGQGA